MTVSVLFLPDDKEVLIKPGTSVLEAALKSKISLPHKCGGKGACLTCKISINDLNAVSGPTKSEIQKLGKHHLESGTRLGCQTKIIRNVTINIPEDPLKAAIRKQLAKQNKESSIWDD